MDYSKAIRDLTQKATRQRENLEATEQTIAGLRKLQEAANASQPNQPKK